METKRQGKVGNKMKNAKNSDRQIVSFSAGKTYDLVRETMRLNSYDNTKVQ